ARGEHGSVVVEGDGINRLRMAGQCARLLGRAVFPKLHGVVEACAGQQLAVGAKGETVDFLGVAFEFARSLSPRQSDGGEQKRTNKKLTARHQNVPCNTRLIAACSGGWARTNCDFWRKAAPQRVLCNSPRQQELQQIIRPARLRPDARQLEAAKGLAVHK